MDNSTRKMTPIVIPGIERIGPDGVFRRPKSLAAHQRMRSPCLDGFATLYNKAYVHDGQVKVLRPGCFAGTLRAEKSVDFFVEHDRENAVASTRDNLSLVDRPEGLAFRLRLPKTMLGYVVGRMVDNDNKVGMSIGYRANVDECRDIGGTPVRIISDAELVEISLVRRGAVALAFTAMVDGDDVPSPTAESLSPTFELRQSWHRLETAFRRLEETLTA